MSSKSLGKLAGSKRETHIPERSAVNGLKSSLVSANVPLTATKGVAMVPPSLTEGRPAMEVASALLIELVDRYHDVGCPGGEEFAEHGLAHGFELDQALGQRVLLVHLAISLIVAKLH
jgi:hypothetical protein